MKSVVKIGTVGEERFVVGEQHLIDFAHDGMPQIPFYKCVTVCFLDKNSATNGSGPAHGCDAPRSTGRLSRTSDLCRWITGLFPVWPTTCMRRSREVRTSCE